MTRPVSDSDFPGPRASNALSKTSCLPLTLARFLHAGFPLTSSSPHPGTNPPLAAGERNHAQLLFCFDLPLQHSHHHRGRPSRLEKPRPPYHQQSPRLLRRGCFGKYFSAHFRIEKRGTPMAALGTVESRSEERRVGK